MTQEEKYTEFATIVNQLGTLTIQHLKESPWELEQVHIKLKEALMWTQLALLQAEKPKIVIPNLGVN